jgi:hypothetical protein
MMLAPIVFLLALLLALTGGFLEASLRAAKVTLQTAVARDSEVAITDGVADLTGALARFVELHGTTGPWPQQTAASAAHPLCSATAPGAAGETGAVRCPLTYTIRASITSASDAQAGSGADGATNLQAAVIDEQRVSAVVTVTIDGPGGTLATRTRFLTYRVFETAPYAVVSGSRDSTTVEGTQAAAQGDTGGAASGADTRIHVRLICRPASANGNDGLPWGNAAQAAYETACLAPDTPADAFRSERWTNGDTNASGWTQ